MKLAVVHVAADGTATTDEFDIPEVLNNVSLGNLDILQKSTKEPGFGGITRKLIKTTFERLGAEQLQMLEAWKRENPDASDDEFVGMDGDDFLSDEGFRASIVGLIFLGRRHAGRKDTVDDARNVTLTQFRLIPDEDEVEEADPKDGADLEESAGAPTLSTPSPN